MDLLGSWLDEVIPGDAPVGICAPYGLAVMSGGGRLDVARFLKLSRERWVREGRFRWGEGVPAPGSEALGPVVFCTGIAAAGEPAFGSLHFRPAKGELLTVRIEGEGLGEGRVWNRSGTWLASLGDGLFRCGATYAWGLVDAVPTAEGRDALERRLAEFMTLRWQVVEHDAAVRPVIRRSRLLMGRLPGTRDAWVMNGLGSKGVLTAPYFAGQLARSLLYGEALDPEVDLAQGLARG
jgi:glycine/D-amino acid oxidase-like deaminating enzyme